MDKIKTDWLKTLLYKRLRRVKASKVLTNICTKLCNSYHFKQQYKNKNIIPKV